MRHLLAIALCAVAACATSAGGGGAPDADPNAPDADPNAPDADPNAPDADPNAPDADPNAPDAEPCATAPCDLIDQCGCAGTMACDIDFTDLMGNACRGVVTAGDESDTCTAVNQCAEGYVCLGDGACKRYCDADADCGTPRGQCVIQIVDDQTPAQPIAGAVVCSSNCDPTVASNASCPATWACDLYNATFGGVEHDITDCRPSGTATQGQTCSATVACAAAHTCVNDGGLKCGKICKRPSGAGCTGGETCFGYTTPLIVGGQEYGVCLL